MATLINIYIIIIVKPIKEGWLMKVKDLINIIPEIISITGPTEASVKSITETSTETKMGTLFVAIQGDSYDGHDFICDALSRGASAVIGEKAMVLDDRAYIRVKNSRKALAASAAWFYGCPGDKLKIIGVTGTSGKTTTTYLIHAMQKESGVRSGIIGTLGYVINSEKIPATYTTPGPLCLNRLFKRMLEENLDSVVMEVSSHSLKLHRVEGIKYEVGLFTNLTQDHLDFHKTFDDYFHSKQKLFQQSKYAVINVDDENGEELAGSMNIPVWSYGINKNSDFMAKNIHITAKGVAYDLVFKNKKHPVFYPVPGLFSVYNSLAALATCTVLNYPLENSIRALKKIKGISGRFELIKNNKGINVIVDYAHKPDGLKNVLLTIKGFGTGRIITVFGCGGDRDKEKRHMMGEISSRLSDYTIITSDNPRSEDPRTIIEQIEAGIIGDNYEKIIDRRKAIQRAILMAQKSDTVLIAGKGHENYQIIGDRRIHFDDREVAKEFLNKGGPSNAGIDSQRSY